VVTLLQKLGHAFSYLLIFIMSKSICVKIVTKLQMKQAL
jgi:hypothetical protein